jgi:hypothetical protein
MSSRASTLLVWNRRLHYYIGLYLLFFCWLFAFTGLLLNHPKWTFAEFWPNRVRSTVVVYDLRAVAGITDVERARDLAQQLRIPGEIQLSARQPADGSFTFQINRPGHLVDVAYDAAAARATLLHTALNSWGVMNLLHTFTGVRAGDVINDRDWTLTTIWALTMDAVSLGLIVMVVSSYVMWYQLDGKRLGGVLAIGLGSASCGAIVFGIRWLTG